MRVLEAREIGHGILVENDGYISPEDNKSIIKEIEEGNRMHREHNILVEKYGFDLEPNQLVHEMFTPEEIKQMLAEPEKKAVSSFLNQKDTLTLN